MSEGSADEDWNQIHGHSTTWRKVHSSVNPFAGWTESKEEGTARTFRSKSDPMHSEVRIDYHSNKEDRRNLSSKAFEEWLRKKDEEAMNLEEKRIKAVERELEKLMHTKETEGDKISMHGWKERGGSL